MSLPSIETIGRGLLITVVSLVIINLVKPYLPSQAAALLSSN